MNTENPKKRKHESLTHGLGITGLVLGILTLLVSFVPCLGAYAIYIGILALLISLIALGISIKNDFSKGIIIAGIIISVIGSSIAIWQMLKMIDFIEELDDQSEVLENSTKDFEKFIDKEVEEFKNDLEKDLEDIDESFNELGKNTYESESEKIISRTDEADEKLIKKMNEINQKSIEPEIESKKKIVPTNYENIIHVFLSAEEKSDFDKIYSYFSPKLSRYYDINNPNYKNLKNRYEYLWGFVSNSRNYVKSIDKINEYTYDLNTNYKYYNEKKKKEFSTNSTIRFLFDSNGKVIETYGIE